MRVGVIGTALCVVAGLCMVAALLVDLDSTAAKVLMVVSACSSSRACCVTFVWMRMRIGPPA